MLIPKTSFDKLSEILIICKRNGINGVSELLSKTILFVSDASAEVLKKRKYYDLACKKRKTFNECRKNINEKDKKLKIDVRINPDDKTTNISINETAEENEGKICKGLLTNISLERVDIIYSESHIDKDSLCLGEDAIPSSGEDIQLTFDYNNEKAEFKKSEYSERGVKQAPVIRQLLLN